MIMMMMMMMAMMMIRSWRMITITVPPPRLPPLPLQRGKATLLGTCNTQIMLVVNESTNVKYAIRF